MATILFLSSENRGLSLAHRLAGDGHIVKVFSKINSNALDGFNNPSKIQKYMTLVEQYDLVVVDGPGMGKEVESLREKGKLVVGGDSFSDKLFHDQNYALKIVLNTMLDLRVPHMLICRSVEDIGKIIGAGERLILKDIDGNVIYISDTKDNRTLGSLMKNNGLFPCIIQERLDGINVSIEGWFNGSGYVKPNNLSFKYRRLMDGGKGPLYDCMGNVVWCLGDGDRLSEMALDPLIDLLSKVKYVGPISIELVARDDGVYFIKFNPGFSYNSIQAYLELIRMSLFDYLYMLANGDSKDVPYQKEGYGLSISMFWDDYANGLDVLEIPEAAEKHVWLNDIRKNDDHRVLSGKRIGCVSSRGIEMREARRRAYRTVRNIVKSKEVIYRGDIGKNVEDKLFLLKSWGWI